MARTPCSPPSQDPDTSPVDRLVSDASVDDYDALVHSLAEQWFCALGVACAVWVEEYNEAIAGLARRSSEGTGRVVRPAHMG
jgi:hypothetical protein